MKTKEQKQADAQKVERGEPDKRRDVDEDESVEKPEEVLGGKELGQTAQRQA